VTQGQETALSAIQWWVDDHRHRDRGDDDGHGEELDPGGGSLYLLRIVRRMADVTTYRSYRQDVARALMLGLEILVAADIIRTVALAPTLQNVLILGLLVVIRTFLS
jgi:hypothetical protein